jgi:ABC-type polysaccharide/polyol phosphate transport system ATPase subunit
MNDIAIKIDNVCKEYRLGAIGGATLREDVNRWLAKLRGKEDPSLRIGQKQHSHNEKFLALDNVSLTVRKGERVGIIGHNGAGKSTLLKLLSRVTAPTSGTIAYNGRISSMLEVGTGFHGELTGRENIFMNGAILGMTKKEIDQKLDDIIAFAEMEQFIDTPVKRYSSGMYVKLAFAVAAHLDNEILVMDEVLAVGDMKFQQKCLEKMNDASKSQGKTILYVSHNMNTIRQLCERCIVLDHGHIIFDGDPNQAINIYLGIRNATGAIIDLKSIIREKPFDKCPSTMEALILDNESGVYAMDSSMKALLKVSSTVDVDNIILGIYFHCQGIAVTSMKSEPIIRLQKNRCVDIPFEVDLSRIAPASYTTKLVLSIMNEQGQAQYFDALMDCYAFSIYQRPGFMHNQPWNVKYNGFMTGSAVKIYQK